MTDDAIQLAVPALTLGYSIKQDKDGKFYFWNDECDIMFRDGFWYLIDCTGELFEYRKLINALKAGAIEDKDDE